MVRGRLLRVKRSLGLCSSGWGGGKETPSGGWDEAGTLITAAERLALHIAADLICTKLLQLPWDLNTRQSISPSPPPSENRVKAVNRWQVLVSRCQGPLAPASFLPLLVLQWLLLPSNRGLEPLSKAHQTAGLLLGTATGTPSRVQNREDKAESEFALCFCTHSAWGLLFCSPSGVGGVRGCFSFCDPLPTRLTLHGWEPALLASGT